MTVSEATCRAADLNTSELWLRYFGLGGMSTTEEMTSYLQREVVPGTRDHDLLAQALNERFWELGLDWPVTYAQALPVGHATRTPDPTDVHLGLLGAFNLRAATRAVLLPMSAQRVLCFLALHDGALLRRHVAGTLWSETTDERAAGSLRSALWRLRVAARPLIEAVDAHVRLLPSVAVDVHESEALARRILDPSQELSETDLEGGLLSLELLPDWTEDWVLVRRNHHTQLRLRALDALTQRLCGLGRFGQAVEAGTLAVSIEPLRESAQRVLVSAHLAVGNVAAAAQQYKAFRELLHDELGLEPSSGLRLLAGGLSR